MTGALTWRGGNPTEGGDTPEAGDDGIDGMVVLSPRRVNAPGTAETERGHEGLTQRGAVNESPRPTSPDSLALYSAGGTHPNSPRSLSAVSQISVGDPCDASGTVPGARAPRVVAARDAATLLHAEQLAFPVAA